jgi:hypothetical protein
VRVFVQDEQEEEEESFGVHTIMNFKNECENAVQCSRQQHTLLFGFFFAMTKRGVEVSEVKYGVVVCRNHSEINFSMAFLWTCT